MKLSEIPLEMILNQLRESAEALSVADLEYIESLREATIGYIKAWTGINSVSEPDKNGRMLDDYDDLVYPFMAIISFMYDNRQMTIDKSAINPVAAATLDMHSFTFIPEDDEE